MTVAPSRKGWCPGALTPMQTGDGLLVRVRAPRGRLSLDQAAALADVAEACGNGAMSLSARGNLHLRGLSDRTLPELQARLGEVGLIDDNPEVERLRNIVASPLDNIDPDARFDLGPGIAALEARLRDDKSLRALPPKFSFVFDALGRLPLGDVHADIDFEAYRSPDGARFAVFLAGDDAISADCDPTSTGDAVARIARAFLQFAGAGENAAHRIRALVARIGAGAVFAEAGLIPKPRLRSRRPVSLRDVLGSHHYRPGVVVGAAAAFGEFQASRWKRLIEEARAAGAIGLRLTPWRAFLIVGLDQGAAPSVTRACEDLGFIVSADDPRLRVAACAGAPACAHAHRPLREDAARWAALLPKWDRVLLHVSGCAKGCAKPGRSAATLTATANGYDFVLAGRAGDPPAWAGLSIDRVADLLLRNGGKIFTDERPSA